MTITFDELRCPGFYEDERGREPVVFFAKGEEVRAKIRGVEVTGGFDGLVPPDREAGTAAGFTLCPNDYLCAYRLVCELPI
jgi:hypothetical protein